jgi:hypothetical protein
MTDATIRTLAGLAAVGVLAAPAIVAGCRKATAWVGSQKTTPPLQSAGVGISAMRTVLELANKLKAAGLTDGVMLCQQLLDVMLGNAPKAKK